MHHHGSINWIALAAALSIVTSEARAIMARSLETISKARWETRPARPGRKRCPIWGVAMLGSRTAPTSGDIDYFESLNCDLVMDCSVSNNPRLAPRNQ
jgi:hypothetical protein